ncbi:spore germination protein KC [Fontibacillus panacisegetis]|uniref:Spore germination protein KC n=1 Tax=Fontibacillus panacisegetis TaxID=670482 RepID=A0A1G7EDH3_9BACL|nr:Ger(x)C family spore germination protein [Fontibacillus panacisegetis]SDE61682.1 spore germination protein KC [Fontibacillus panacisegetis]
MNKYCKIFSCGCLLIITALMLSGCWNRNELIDLSIVLALGVDKVGNEYEVSVQAIDPSSMSRNRSTNRAPTTVFSEREPTVFEALRKMTTKSPRRMYVSHLRFIVFDEATAREGIHNPLDFLFREQEIRPDFNMAVAKDCKAKDIIGFVSPTEVLPGMDMYKSLKISQRVWSPTSAVNVREIMSKLVMEGVEPVLTGLALHGDIKQGGTSENVKKPVPLANYVYEGIGVFKDDKLIGWMNEDESRGYSYITNNAKSSVARAKCPDGGKGWFNVELIRSKAKIEPSIKNDRPHIKVRVQSQGNIGEVQCAVDLMDPEMHRKFQETISNKLNVALDGSVKRAKEYGVDVFGFGEAFHRKYPKHWREWKGRWGEMFKNELVVDIQVEFQILLHGKINNPFTVEQSK